MQPLVNDHDHINGLPAELLLDIFRHNLDERTFGFPKSYYRSVFQLVLVCRRWKDILQRDQYTWGFIPQGVTGPVVQDLLNRSGVAPIRIADRTNTSRDLFHSLSVFNGVLIPHSHRWQELSLIVGEAHYHQLRDILEAHNLPLLTSLRLFASEFSDFHTQAPSLLQRNRPPRLRKLVLKHLSVGFSPAWRGLEHLVIVLPRWHPSLNDVLNVLQASPLLQTLNLEFAGDRDGGKQVPNNNDLIPLPHLKYLRLHWENYTYRILPLLAMEPDEMRDVDMMLPTGTDTVAPSTNTLFSGMLRRAEAIYIQLSDHPIRMFSWRITNIHPHRAATSWKSAFHITSIAGNDVAAALPDVVRFLVKIAPNKAPFFLYGLDDGHGILRWLDWLRPFGDLRGEFLGVEAAVRYGGGRGVVDALAKPGWYWHIGPFKQLVLTVHTHYRGTISDTIRHYFMLDRDDRKARAQNIKALHLETLLITILEPGVVLGPDWDRTSRDLMDSLGVEEVHLIDSEGNALPES